MAETPLEVTRTLARYVCAAKISDHPSSVLHEVKRTFLNWLGCAIGGASHEAVEIAISALAPFSGPAQASVLGRSERLDVIHAALINGISSHVFDFDDLHLRTMIHPASPVCAAGLAIAEFLPASGGDLLNALLLGLETECRIGAAVYPAHYTAGWHITSTCGVFGAAVAAGSLLGLNEDQMVYALGLAASQPVGLKIMFGTMVKSFQPGRAAQNGVTAAILASKGYVAAERALEAKGGWGEAVTPARNWNEVVDNLGQRYEASFNTYKPYSCGMLTHPAIEGCLHLRNQFNLDPGAIESVELRVHPQVFELTGNKTPNTGLAAKFSIYHCVCVALIYGGASEKQFSDEVVRDLQITRLRGKVTATVDSALMKYQAGVTIRLKNGAVHETFVEAVSGSNVRPMTDCQLENKLLELTFGILPETQARKAIELCWNIVKLPSVAAISCAASLSSGVC